MLDTIKVGIPLTAQQHKRISAKVKDDDRYQWVMMHQKTGEIFFRRVKGLAHADHHSYHRELYWDMDATYESNCKLTLEFSVPKFWYGHNIRLLHNFMPALNELRKILNHEFKFGKKLSLLPPECWAVLRVDICYGWNLQDEQTAQHYLNSLKPLTYPKKKPIIYPESIVFPGGTLTLKFYLKHPEFKVHDRKALLKAKASLEWVEWLESISTGVLRCEATLRRKYLQRKEIKTVSDLLKPLYGFEWDTEVAEQEDTDSGIVFFLIMNEYMKTKGLSVAHLMDVGVTPPFEDGTVISIPEGELSYTTPDGRTLAYYHPGGGCVVRVASSLEVMLQHFIERFVGMNVKMQSADEVKLKLLQHYKPVKASRLAAFWLYVQRFGEADAKETFGRDSFYASKRDLKKADVSLLDKSKLITHVDQNFLRDFELAVPSKYCVNQHDDYRESANILNFTPMTSGNHFA